MPGDPSGQDDPGSFEPVSEGGIANAPLVEGFHVQCRVPGKNCVRPGTSFMHFQLVNTVIHVSQVLKYGRSAIRRPVFLCAAKGPES